MKKEYGCSVSPTQSAETLDETRRENFLGASRALTFLLQLLPALQGRASKQQSCGPRTAAGLAAASARSTSWTMLPVRPRDRSGLLATSTASSPRARSSGEDAISVASRVPKDPATR